MIAEKIIQNVRNKVLGTAGIVTGVVITTVFVINCVYKIAPGMAGVQYSMDGGIVSETLGQGYHIVWPWRKVVEYPVSTEVVYYNVAKDGAQSSNEEKDNGIDISTKDGKTVHVSVTYAFHMDEDKLPEVFTKFRGQSIEKIEAGYMKSELLRCINEVTAKYNLMDVVGEQRQTINNEVFQRLKESLGEFGVIVETLNISDAKPDTATAEAIQKVIDAQNKLQQATIEKQTAEQEAEKRVIEAKGKADAARIEAEGIAAANDLVRKSLSPELVKQHAVDKWDGKLPHVSGADNILLEIPAGDQQ